MILKRPFLFSLAFGIATSSLIGVVGGRLPYSETRDVIIDVLTLPGGLIAGLAYPEGVHTGHGAPMFGFWAMAANLGVYILFWYALLRAIRYLRKKGQSPGTVP